MMLKVSQINFFLFAVVASISLISIVKAESTAKLTIAVNGIRQKKGEVCFRIFSDQRGFPLGDTSEVKSGCTQITGSSVKKEFYGLKLGTYAVAVLEDHNGDHKLNRNFLGIPQEGFGISNNPNVTLQTGAPKFTDASFSLKQDMTIRISMKYFLSSEGI